MTKREQAVRNALAFEGVAEQPLGSNRGPVVFRNGMKGGITFWLAEVGFDIPAAWCMAFVHGMFKLAGVVLGGYASVGNFLNWAAANGEIVKRPRRGDLSCYFWDADDWADHVEFVVRVLALRWKSDTFVGWIQTVGGNTGDQVKQQRRWIHRAKFVRIPD